MAISKRKKRRVLPSKGDLNIEELNRRPGYEVINGAEPSVKLARNKEADQIARYHNRRIINDKQRDAAARLYADWYKARGSQGITANYGAVSGGVADHESVQKAEQRLKRVTEYVGKRLFPILVHVVWTDHSCE